VTPSRRNERLYLADILDAIDKILGYTRAGKDAFLADSRTQDAVLRNIEIIGEAVRGITAETRAAHQEIPWKEMAGMRDRSIHDYFRVDVEVVWDVVSQDLPPLREQIASLLT
jgi:uncharacterized protein with HEPN domain